jgi:hypothetical protein
MHGFHVGEVALTVAAYYLMFQIGSLVWDFFKEWPYETFTVLLAVFCGLWWLATGELPLDLSHPIWWAKHN